MGRRQAVGTPLTNPNSQTPKIYSMVRGSTLQKTRASLVSILKISRLLIFTPRNGERLNPN